MSVPISKEAFVYRSDRKFNLSPQSSRTMDVQLIYSSLSDILDKFFGDGIFGFELALLSGN